MGAPRASLRALEESDVERVIAIADSLGLSPWSRADYIAELKRTDAYMSVASIDEEITGFLVARRVPGPAPDSWEAELYNIGVSRNFQFSGIGKLLMDGLINRCRRGGVQEIWLEVRRKNHSAIRFYQGFGFEESGLRTNFYRDPTDDALLMRLKIRGV